MSRLRETSGETAASDDETLIERIAGGDSVALSLLYDRYARLVFGMALRVLANRETAEDIVQETFWRVWRRSGTFRTSRGQVVAWITGIAHNLAIDELRRQRARPNPVYDAEDRPVLRELEDTRSDVVGAALDGERRRLISAALARIPEEQRAVIELAYFAGLSQSEIAEYLQNPIGTVKTRARLALQKLRDILNAQGFAQEDLSD
ncbi:MAG TPA: sigma-70 family RNA polymerase sigma factor [Roseiflexaceae bacterium]|nr:sigma-70 family RNA polymerase sigma factor [Roseiflexaceae bacterium]